METHHRDSSAAGLSIRALAALALLTMAGCRGDAGLKPFTSDGCSLFPDRALISGDDWCACCFEHDIAYWRGGTRDERKAADAALRDCVEAKTGNRAFAQLMYEGVRAGGSPYFLTWYRWGYGWPFERKYEALTETELELAERLLDDHRSANPEPVCPVEPPRTSELNQ